MCWRAIAAASACALNSGRARRFPPPCLCLNECGFCLEFAGSHCRRKASKLAAKQLGQSAAHDSVKVFSRKKVLICAGDSEIIPAGQGPIITVQAATRFNAARSEKREQRPSLGPAEGELTKRLEAAVGALLINAIDGPALAAAAARRVGKNRRHAQPEKGLRRLRPENTILADQHVFFKSERRRRRHSLDRYDATALYEPRRGWRYSASAPLYKS